MKALLDTDEDDLPEAERLEVIEAIDVLGSSDDDTKARERQVREGRRFKDLAPKAWTAATPVLSALLTAELKKQLGLP